MATSKRFSGKERDALLEKQIKILADMFANSMEYLLEDNLEEYIESNYGVKVGNAQEVVDKYWEMDALETADPSKNWEEWVRENVRIII